MKKKDTKKRDRKRKTDMLESNFAETKYPRFCELIGNTPLIDITAMAEPNIHGVNVKVLGKAEFMNPGLSHKDRVISHIISKAEKAGKITPNSGNTLLAGSSGNTGASLAMIGAMRGYNVVIITNAKCSTEKMDTIKMYGAKLILAEEG